MMDAVQEGMRSQPMISGNGLQSLFANIAEMADAINQTIAFLAGNHTIIMITHQLKAAIQANRIFALDQGHLVEQGTHKALLAQNGHYRYL